MNFLVDIEGIYGQKVAFRNNFPPKTPFVNVIFFIIVQLNSYCLSI